MEIRVKRVMLSDDAIEHSDIPSDELYHWGIKGMKWGVRRYQNKDGSLTAAGKKHRSLGQYIHDKKVAKKRKEAAAKARETKAKNAAEKAKREKKLARNAIPVKKMTDEELAASMKRLQNEQKYLEQVRETSTWKRFTHKFVNDAVISGASEAGKALVSSYLKKQGEQLLGLKDKPSAHEKLKEAAEAAKLRKEMYENQQDLENAKRNKELNDNVTKAKAEAELAKAKKSKATEERQHNRIVKEMEAESNAQKQVDDYNESWRQGKDRDTPSSNGGYSKKGSEIKDAVYDTGKNRVKNELSVVGNRSVTTVSKSNVEKGEAWLQDKHGNDIVPVDVTIKKDDD